MRAPSIGACLALVAVGSGGADTGAPLAVSVDSAGGAFTVKVARPTPLRAALETICRETEARCELPSTLPDAAVDAGEIHGSWQEVLAQLLHGTGLSFAATPPAPGRPPYLMVAAPAPADAKAVEPRADQRQEGTAEPAVVEEPEPSQDTAAAPADEPAQEARTPPDPTQVGAVVSAEVAATMPGASFAMTPFSDAKGTPLVTRLDGQGKGSSSATPGQAVLPFSDEIGNPMVVPITNEPLALTPFVGPDGEAWPAPVPQPNQKLQYPGPTTVPTPKPENP